MGFTPVNTRTERSGDRVRLYSQPKFVRPDGVTWRPIGQVVSVERDKTTTRHVKLERRFIPNCEVRTDTDVIRGVLVEVDPSGAVKLEIRPGIIKTIPAAAIRYRGPIREKATE